jgi:hypothetical protein
MIQFRPIYVICLREFIKFFREKSRLLGTLAPCSGSSWSGTA